MIWFEQRPPKNPGDVVLTESGIAIILDTARPATVTTLFGERFEKAAEIAPRIALLGRAIRDTIEVNADVADRGTILFELIAGNVVEQLREALVDESGLLSEENRTLARNFGVGVGGYVFAETRQEAIV